MTANEKLCREVVLEIWVRPLDNVVSLDVDGRTNCCLDDVVQEYQEAEEVRTKCLELLRAPFTKLLDEGNYHIEAPE